ncbi:bifunctional UDP-sugar hydrolase/5'-nucleotidase [Croceicoccus sp. YJ47]|uniref:bifunctional metallophosphatase/5'-nucleotidase n=1 Tax=Croceicoccus sp. YJ47 TaxID=2798724 RepID=UPI0019206BAB|nr:bifunctional metallophosphatase/5'-nucleotidase [Croceicoccus sp. YJ47]QQN73443.1 bifunctional metallophosphatase/5'-nucleotidase [Croceicoccus sp. YJ47]
MTRILLATTAALALSACATVPQSSPATSAAAMSAAPVTVRIVGLNDFHGNLEPQPRPLVVTTPDGQERSLPAGGAAYLASAVHALRAQDDYSLVISAGDLISASPLASSLFLDEPTIGAMNRIGLDFNAVGNHEFDRGADELRRMADGGCAVHTLRTPCAVEPDFAGADFGFLAANVATADGGTLFPAYAIRRFGSGADEIAIAVIGLTLEGTPSLVSPGGVAGLTFRDEAETINALVPGIEAEGADAIIVSIHQGLVNSEGFDDGKCGALSGDLRGILDRLDPRVDLVLSGHTHNAYVCDYAKVDPARPFWVTSAGSRGTMLTDIALSIDAANGTAHVTDAHNIVVQNADGDGRDAALPAFAADAGIAAYVARYVDAARSASERVVGRLSGALDTRMLGLVIADAQLAATRDSGAEIAFMNAGGVRAPITPGADGAVTFGDIYTSQPFGNTLVTKTFTGAQLLAILEQQFRGDRAELLSVSQGFTYGFDRAAPEGRRIVDPMLNGRAIAPDVSYRVTMNSFLAGGGDGFTTFEAGRDTLIGPIDVDALERWIGATDAAMPVRERVRDLTRR